MKRTYFSLVFLLMIVLGGCNLVQSSPQTPGADAIATKVAGTMQAFTRTAEAQEPQVLLATPTLPPPTLSETPTSTQPLPTLTLTLTPTLAMTLTPSVTTTSRPGSIAGNIVGYPYGKIPRLAVVAFDQKTTYLMYWYWITGAGEAYYSMDKYIPPSTYQVVAYDSSSHAGGCTVLVVVTSDSTATCDITNWAGSYPSKPSDVPTP